MARSNVAGHETIRDSGPKKTASDRSFGYVFCVVFCIIAALQFFAGRVPIAIGLAGGAAFFLLAALVKPKLLAPLNKLWTAFGLVLHRIMNPLILGIMFFIVCTPMGVVMRCFGYDPLRMKPDGDADSYWIVRDPAGPSPETMKNQF